MGELAFVLAAAVPLLAVMPGRVRGFVAGAWLATGLWFLIFQILLASGTAPQMMGERGEQFTASELRRLRRRGWRVVNHVILKGRRDMDHIAVGPEGVLVVETKWRGDPWRLSSGGDDRVRDAVSLVASDAVILRGMFPNDVARSAIVPLVVLWGGYNKSDVSVSEIDGVTVLRGDVLRGWLVSFAPGGALSRTQQDRVWDVLERHVDRRDASDLERDGPPRKSPGEAIGWLVSVLFAAWLGLTVSALASQLSPALFGVAELALVASGWFVLRTTRWVGAAKTWLVSVVAVGLLVAVAAVLDAR